MTRQLFDTMIVASTNKEWFSNDPSEFKQVLKRARNSGHAALPQQLSRHLLFS